MLLSLWFHFQPEPVPAARPIPSGGGGRPQRRADRRRRIEEEELLLGL